MKMVRAVFATILLVLGLPPALLHARVGLRSGLTRLPGPRTAEVEGCVQAHCVDLARGMRLCKCMSESDAEFVLERDKTRAGKWPAEAFLGATADFEVLRGDLDGDGRNEIAVANHDATGVGMAMKTWTIFILPDPQTNAFQMPLAFGVAEYGSRGTFIYHQGNRSPAILATEWVSGKDPQGKRGEGLYLVGRWFRYKSGRLETVAARPVLARRYLNAFAHEREQTLDDALIPHRWFTNAGTEARKVDPFVNAQELASARGVIQEAFLSAGTLEASAKLTVVIKLDSGETVKLVHTSFRTEEDKAYFDHLGQEATRRIYPKEYMPFQIERWLKNRRARLATYDDGSTGRKVLWLIDP